MDGWKHVLKELLMSTRVISLVLIGTLLFTLGTVVVWQRSSQAHGTDGYAWLSWNNDARQFYILGFLQAYLRGFVQGCLAADDIAIPRWTVKEINACEDKQMRYSRDLQILITEITQFYKEYPEDRSLELDVLLMQFSDQKNRSPKQIHELLQKNQPL